MSRPWSADREKYLTMARDTAFYALMGCCVGAAAAFILPFANHRIGWLLLPVAIGLLLLALWAQMGIAEMLPNRPVDTAHLTPWKFWPHNQEQFDCKCGRRLDFADAVYRSNREAGLPKKMAGSIGRHSMICPGCGQGHYKHELAGQQRVPLQGPPLP